MFIRQTYQIEIYKLRLEELTLSVELNLVTLTYIGMVMTKLYTLHQI